MYRYDDADDLALMVTTHYYTLILVYYSYYVYRLSSEYTYRALRADAHFAPQNILLPGTFCSSEHFAHWYIFLLNIVCSLEHLSGHFSQKQAKTKVVEIKNPDFSYWA